ncbi:interleukin-22 receptor subunit alpha-1 isoform X1 [Pipistrellus kuhlii]|uniref:interleukin-22 receptor subunit alpha-1 isoform X1 n=1 Tax=Pipistrellus kuhlii TaxID=59472 RepID=UPI00174EE7DB|nr:interleukin-22 receptor subunit alpha-1 isoform X1 [Pipistrellus kuhlii]
MRTLLTILAAGSLAAAHIAEDTSDLLQRVTFQSSNFENILTWDSGLESAPDTVYSVEYKTYGEPAWLAKEGCQRITRKFCNLTAETGSLMELYYGRVTATGAGGRSATKMTERFSSLQHTTIKPPDVTCIPTVRSIQMIVHPTSTPLRAKDGHQLTLEEIFHDLFYRLDLHINQTYQMHLGGKQREYEFIGLPPDTEFLGTITILVPSWSKESAPHTCRVRTLPDPTWTYSFSGAFLFSMGFLVAVLCYLSYRYVTKPPQPPNSLDVQRVLTFQPLRFIQEHVLVPVLDLSGPGGLAQPCQYSQVTASVPKEPTGAMRRHSRPEVTYLGQPSQALPPQTGSPPSYAPQAAPEAGPPAYTPQATPEAKAPSYAPQAVSSYTPQAAPDSWPPSYGVCMEASGKDSAPGTGPSPKPLRTKGQLQREPPAAGLSLQGVAPGAWEEPQEAKSFPQHLCADTDRAPGTAGLHQGEPGAPGYLKGQLPLLASVQIEGRPASLPLHTPSLPRRPTDQASCPGGLLESLVCPKDDGPGSEPEATSVVAPGASAPEQPTELDSLFRDLALTVQWEA